jgi:hypothetical protein
MHAEVPAVLYQTSNWRWEAPSFLQSLSPLPLAADIDARCKLSGQRAIEVSNDLQMQTPWVSSFAFYFFLVSGVVTAQAITPFRGCGIVELGLAKAGGCFFTAVQACPALSSSTC